MKQIMAVYDADPFYADRFAEFVNQREKIPFSVMAFTSLERLRQFSQENSIEILLVNRGVEKEEIKKINARQIMTLSDGELVPLNEEYPSVYKYQSTDSVIREVMACYCEQPLAESISLVSGSAPILGIYSPLGRCLKTSLSLIIGQLLAKDRRVLYISLEEYSGLAGLTGMEYRGDLSDVLYYYRQDSYNWMKLSSCIYTWGGMDYIAPVRYPEDLLQISGEDLSQLLRRIARESEYEIVVVDFGHAGKYSLELLDCCQVIYMPIREDCVSAAKLAAFEHHLETGGPPGLREKIEKLKLPYHSGFGRRETYMEQLLWGELGDYARQLLKGRISSWES